MMSASSSEGFPPHFGYALHQSDVKISRGKELSEALE